MGRSLLKHWWRASTQTLRLLFCAGLCLLRARKRFQDAAGGEPLFVCGAFCNASGLAQGARLYAEACRQQGRLAHLVDITGVVCMPRDLEPMPHAVPCALTPVRMRSDPYKGCGARWAEPDVEAATEILRELHQELTAANA